MSTPKLAGLFLTYFDTTAGARVQFEVPEGIATQELESEGGASIFAVVKEYAIPKPSLCGHLVTVCTRAQKVLGFPVRIESEVYPRGGFVWSVSWVFQRDAELAAYEPLVRKTGRVLEALETSSLFLSSTDSRHRVHAVIEQCVRLVAPPHARRIYEDLNSYAETSIVLGGPSVLDLRLFPTLPNPPAVRDWDVPVPLVDLASARDLGWDLTLYRIIPYIDGVHTIGRIAKLADVDPALARIAVQHLIYFSCAVIVDLFQYSNSYALVSGAAGLPATCGEPVGGDGLDVGRECAAYVGAGGHTRACRLLAGLTHTADTLRLLQLYSKLQPGLRISEWIDANDIPENEIDVRRMIQFGVIKGFLRRVHLYPIWLAHSAYDAAVSARPSFSFAKPPDERPSDRRVLNASSTTARSRNASPARLADVPRSLRSQLDGTHHTDELCVRYRVSLDQLQAMLRAIGNVELVYI